LEGKEEEKEEKEEGQQKKRVGCPLHDDFPGWREQLVNRKRRKKRNREMVDGECDRKGVLSL